MLRQAQINRETRETRVSLYLNLDGKGASDIDTGYPFFDHMLELFCWHGFFDLKVKAQGDIKVDKHHLVEDVGICLGRAFSQAIKDKRGIKRYGWSIIPMDEVLVQCTVDVSGRPLLVFRPGEKRLREGAEEFFKDFFRAFSTHSGITLHINVFYGEGYHHILEGIFKALGISLDQATRKEERREGSPSSKGMIEEI